MTGETPLLCAAKQGHVEAIIRHKENARAWRSHFDTRDKEDIHESSSYVYFNFILLFSTASHRQVAAPESTLITLLVTLASASPSTIGLSPHAAFILYFRQRSFFWATRRIKKWSKSDCALIWLEIGFIRSSCVRRSALILLIEMANISVNFHQILRRSAILSTFELWSRSVLAALTADHWNVYGPRCNQNHPAHLSPRQVTRLWWWLLSLVSQKLWGSFR